MDNGLPYFVRSAQRGEEVSSEHVLVFFVRSFFVVWWWWSLACQGFCLFFSSFVQFSSRVFGERGAGVLRCLCFLK